MLTKKAEKRYFRSIAAVSVLVPVLVAALLFLPFKIEADDQWIYHLPHLNALINSSTAVLLILGWVFIKQKKIELHRNTMLLAFSLGAIFLISYVIYHAFAVTTIYGDTTGDGVLTETELAAVGLWRMVYLTILLSHIALATVVVPLVLLAVFYALTGRIAKHQKIVKYAWPIWLYVSISGVVVYAMISPYYS